MSEQELNPGIVDTLKAVIRSAYEGDDAMREAARAFAIFYVSLIDNGVPAEHAFGLTCQFMATVVVPMPASQKVVDRGA